MSKIIVENKSNISDSEVLKYVSSVIQKGRISSNGKQYSYMSTFGYGAGMYAIYTDLNKKSDRFVIQPYPNSCNSDS